MPEIPNQEILVVVPCYNEEKRLHQEAFISFAHQTSNCGFIFVNDGSSDKTADVLESLQKKLTKQVGVINLSQNVGKAEAVRKGFCAAFNSPKTQFLAFWDADLATPLEELPRFIQILIDRPSVEMVFGARVKLMGHNIRRRLHRHYLGRIFATFVSLAIGLKIYDTQCGAKMFCVTPTLQNIFRTPFKSKWIFDVEILARYIKERKLNPGNAEEKIYELPLTTWHDVTGSKLKVSDFGVACLELAKIFLSYRI